MRLSPAAALVLVPALARAETQARVELEGGTEVDTNPGREPGGDTTSPAGVARAGGRLELLMRSAAGRSLRLNLVGAAKKFTPDAEDEDVGVLSGDGRFDLRLGERPVLLGARGSYYDAFERQTSEAADADFRTGEGGLVLTILAADDQRVVGSGGVRFFTYKPNDNFSFEGEFIGLSYTRAFHLSEADADEPRSLDLSFQYVGQRRRYDGPSYTNVCVDYENDPAPGLCIIKTRAARVDLFHAGMVELVYAGARLFSARYEVHLNDSTSFGESLVRHRLELSGTSELFAQLFVTARVLLQLNQFVDPALRAGDTGTFVTIEDESRNAFVLHVSRELGEALSIEARYAFYTDAFSQNEVDYRRHTLYLGLIYGFQSGP